MLRLQSVFSLMTLILNCPKIAHANVFTLDLYISVLVVSEHTVTIVYQDFQFLNQVAGEIKA